MNPAYFHALGSSIGYGFVVLIIVLLLGALLTFATGGSQPNKWPKSEH